MDEQPLPAEPVPPPAPPPVSADVQDDARLLLQILGRGLDEPVLAMRREIDRMLAEGGEGPGSQGRRESALSLLELCDDLLGMARAWASAPPVAGAGRGATGPHSQA